MKYILKILAFILSGTLLLHLSCKKDLYCKNCDSANKLPIANAGRDTSIVFPIDRVVVDGSASFDPDGNIISYKWTQITGAGSLSIEHPDSARTEVKNLGMGVYQFELKVEDNGGLFDMDTLSVFVIQSEFPADTPALACNPSLTVVAHLPTPGLVRYSVTAGTKILFTRGNGAVDIYDTVTLKFETVNGMHATTPHFADQSQYKTAKVGSKLIFSSMVNEVDKTQGQLINIYDAASNRWSITHLNQARQSYAMAVLGTKVYYAGGDNDFGKMDIYDASSDSWSVLPFNEARSSGMVAISFENKIYFAGGYISRPDSLVRVCDDYGNNCNDMPALVASDRVDILDVTSNAWSTVRLSEAKGSIMAAILGNRIVFAGGVKPYVDNGFPRAFYSSLVELFNPVDNSWAAHYLGSAYTIAPSRNIYTIHTKLLIPEEAGSDKIHIYDDQTNSWSVERMPFPHQTDMHETGLVAAIGNKLIFFLQYIRDISLSRGINIYDASNGTWCHSELEFSLMRTGMVAAGNKVYVAGGRTAAGCCDYDSLVDNVWHLEF